jgi:hypothetical protein
MAKTKQDTADFETTYDDTEDWLLADLQDEDDDADLDDER